MDWLPLTFTAPPEAIIPLMMIYRYRRETEGNITKRKARCNLRGDLMKPGQHYNPEHRTTYTANRIAQILLVALHAYHHYPLEHFEVKSAYLHERYQHDIPVYVKQIPKFDGTYRHNSQYGLLKGNLYGSPPAAFYYNRDLKQHLRKLRFTASEHDPYLYTKVTNT